MPASADNAPIWFVTGCSTGLGRALVQRVLQHGQRAVVTARNPNQIEDIIAADPRNALGLQLDVTSVRQIDEAVSQAEKRFGRIDVLVNNAGYGYLAALEEGEDDQVRAMFETNFFGLIALTKRVLPGMRAQGRGHVVNISSVGGMVGNPSSGYYNATKFAVEGLSEALAKEVAPLGIRVTCIEPGPFRTEWSGPSLKVTRNAMPAYAATAGARRARIAGNYGKQAGDPVRAADAIIKVVESAKPPLNLILGKDGLERVREKLTQLTSSMQEWEPVTLGADYPRS
jgi:NAD(P)-dependent dehydrogenase (short-subunit alcohol dehydrogenase family)